MTHFKRMGAILVAILMALVVASPASAGTRKNEVRCTQDLGNGYTICQKVIYIDNGSTVEIKEMKFYVVNPRKGDKNVGYKVDAFWLFCYTAGGDKYYPIDGRYLTINLPTDGSLYSYIPSSNGCKEADVRFGGFGIKKVAGGFDVREDFGDGYSQLPT